VTAPRLILASASPRRRELLARLGVTPDRIAPADIDETPHPGELARAYAIRMAREKALAVADTDSSLSDSGPADSGLADSGANNHILAGDTVVAAGRRILPKAEDAASARQCLELLSGRRHRVLCAIALLSPDGTLREKMCETQLKFKRLSRQEIDAYIATDEWSGKAGGYAIQGRAEALIPWIQGSHSAVMGLPLYETRLVLQAAGFPLG